MSRPASSKTIIIDNLGISYGPSIFASGTLGISPWGSLGDMGIAVIHPKMILAPRPMEPHPYELLLFRINLEEQENAEIVPQFEQVGNIEGLGWAHSPTFSPVAPVLPQSPTIRPVAP